ncbi:predicted protein, partial [Nematostella vectensis]
RKRSINPPEPMHNFGRKGHLLEDGSHESRMVDPSEHKLAWTKPAAHVLIVKKIFECNITSKFKELCAWLVEERQMVVHVEASLTDEPAVINDDSFVNVWRKLVTFKEGENLEDQIDFIICLGGDGTLLHVSTLFQESCPPVLAFHLGSLGFLTSFRFDRFREHVTKVLDGHARLTLRSRLRCIITKYHTDSNENCKTPNMQRYTVLNEVVIDRGQSPYLSNLEVYCNDYHITSVQGDGLIISTPTGSTAYAVAAGASMVHPTVPAILITPICPHSLSFRPIVLPAGVEIKIVVSLESRNTAWASFDGRNRQELDLGESIRITTSVFPVPSINCVNQVTDWFTSLAECLHWNVREQQQSLSLNSVRLKQQ